MGHTTLHNAGEEIPKISPSMEMERGVRLPRIMGHNSSNKGLKSSQNERVHIL